MASKIAPFDLPHLGFTRAFGLPDLVDGKVPLYCAGEDAVPGASLLPFKLQGLGLKRALAEGKGAFGDKLPALVVFRNVVLNLERSETNRELRSITAPGLSSLTLPPILDAETNAPLGDARVKVSPSISWTYYSASGKVRPRYLTMRDSLGVLSPHNITERIFELSSRALGEYGDTLFAEELYAELIVKESKEGEDAFEVQEVQLKLVYAKCVSEAELLQICCHLGRTVIA